MANRADMPFVGIPSFLRSRVLGPDDPVDADLVILGAPTDEGSPFMPGSRFGPRSIREHSLRFVTGEPGYFDPARGPSFPPTRDGPGPYRRPRRRRHHPHQRGGHLHQHHRTGGPGALPRRHADRARGRPRHLVPRRAGVHRAPLRHPFRRPPRLHAVRPRGLHDQRPRLSPHCAHAACAGAGPGRHPQPALDRGDVAGLAGRRQPGRHHDRVPPAGTPGDRHAAPQGSQLLHQPRYGRARSPPGAGLRLGRARTACSTTSYATRSSR